MALTKTKNTASLEAVIIRADGTREELGVIWHSNIFIRTYYKIMRRIFKWHK